MRVETGLVAARQKCWNWVPSCCLLPWRSSLQRRIGSGRLLAVRLAVDAGLLAIVLASLAAGCPFTLQYARERVPEQYWHAPLFLILTINRRIAWAWAGAFAAMVATHAAVVFVPAVPLWVDIVVTIAALAAAFRFTAWYPGHARKKAADVVVQAGHE